MKKIQTLGFFIFIFILGLKLGFLVVFYTEDDEVQVWCEGWDPLGMFFTILHLMFIFLEPDIMLLGCLLFSKFKKEKKRWN